MRIFSPVILDMTHYTKNFSITHPAVGELELIQCDSDLILSYGNQTQRIKWDLPEPIINVELFGDTIRVTYQFPQGSILKKNLYFSEGSFNFIIPDGICFFVKETIEQWPTVYHRCREGSQVSFRCPDSAESFVIQIHSTKREHDGKYVTDYSFQVGEDVVRSALYPNHFIQVKSFYLYNSPYSGAWPVFLLSKTKLSSEELNSIHPK
ncbi:hypothetical protein [Vibrio coralliilyticus]|uniref:hypothetical protein n=1 Tax=Vibrio coralliilyticus TaxID=190893 RepID=UPI00240A1536|nr:hypothetical protein [Vibrio coralliilyticus]WFB49484.1 hypothetical protein P6988_21795 [Vibrio coralliilyticus]